MENSKLLSVDEVMSRLHLSRTSLYRLESEGKLFGSLRFGKKLYLESDIVNLENEVLRDITKRKEAYAKAQQG